jgi:hypothetical protein
MKDIIYWAIIYPRNNRAQLPAWFVDIYSFIYMYVHVHNAVTMFKGKDNLYTLTHLSSWKRLLSNNTSRAHHFVHYLAI